MKSYELNTEFGFGKFKGKTLREVVLLEPSYLEWCGANLDHFYISEDVIKELKLISAHVT